MPLPVTSPRPSYLPPNTGRVRGGPMWIRDYVGHPLPANMDPPADTPRSADTPSPPLLITPSDSESDGDDGDEDDNDNNGRGIHTGPPPLQPAVPPASTLLVPRPSDSRWNESRLRALSQRIQLYDNPRRVVGTWDTPFDEQAATVVLNYNDSSMSTNPIAFPVYTGHSRVARDMLRETATAGRISISILPVFDPPQRGPATILLNLESSGPPQATNTNVRYFWQVVASEMAADTAASFATALQRAIERAAFHLL